MSVELYINTLEIFIIDNNIRDISGNEYEIQDRINNGGNAVLHKCVNRITGDEYAIKFLLKLNRKMRRRFKQEIEALRVLRHEHLMKYIGHGFVIGKNIRNKEEKNITIPFLIMPLAESNLAEYIKTNKILYDEYIAQFKGLVSALAELHKVAIHRDIKPENILIKGETWILSDFGLCSFLSDETHQEFTSEHENVIMPFDAWGTCVDMETVL